MSCFTSDKTISIPEIYIHSYDIHPNQILHTFISVSGSPLIIVKMNWCSVCSLYYKQDIGKILMQHSCCDLTGYGTIQSDIWLPAFWRNILPLSYILKVEAIYSSETLVSTYQPTWCHNPLHHNMHFHYYGNLTSSYGILWSIQHWRLL